MTDRASGSPRNGQTTGEVLPLVYEQLHILARGMMSGERRGHTLQATALVGEAYLRLSASRGEGWASPEQFYRAAAEAMRRILIEHARKRGAAKRGGGRGRVPDIESVLDLARDEHLGDALALDEAIVRLEGEDREAADVVRLRFFAGLTGDRAAEVLGVSPRQIDRAWAFARAYLLRELRHG